MGKGKTITIDEAARQLSISVRMAWKIVAGGNFTLLHAPQRGRPATVSERSVIDYANALEAAVLFDHPELPTYGAYAPDAPQDRLFLRPTEAARIIEVTPRRLMQIVHAKQLVACRIGRCVLLRPVDVYGYKAYKDGAKPPRRVVRNA